MKIYFAEYMMKWFCEMMDSYQDRIQRKGHCGLCCMDQHTSWITLTWIISLFKKLIKQVVTQRLFWVIVPIIGAFSVQIYQYSISLNKIQYTYKYVLLIMVFNKCLFGECCVTRIWVNLRYRYRHRHNSTLTKILILGVISKNHVKGPRIYWSYYYSEKW